MGPQLFDIIQAIILDVYRSGTVRSLPLPVIRRGRVFSDLENYNPICENHEQYSVVALLKSIGKKFIDTVPGESLTDSQREAAAFEKFLEANDHCRETNGRLRSYFGGCFGGSTPLDSFLRGALGEAQRFIHSALLYEDDNGYVSSDVPIRDLLSSLRCGPGASNGAIGDTYVDKCLRGPLTTTKGGLYSLYRQSLKISPKMYGEDGLERSGSANPALERAEIARNHAFGVTEVSGSKLAFAPKSWKIARTIATEPSLNMMFQLGLHEQLCFFLARKGFSLPTQQERNRCLARQGSLDGRWFTMDLSSASDSVSIELVRYLFPEDWFNWFMLTRSPTVSVNGADVELHMLSSMGNGYTFAVETLVFLSLVVGTYSMLNLPIAFPSRGRTGNIGVYGDDIIGLTEAFGPLSLLLEHVGFTVNRDKSFNDGPFRESCGGDYFRGHDVRGVYSTTVSTPQERVSLINRLAQWGHTHDISFSLTSQVVLKGDPLMIVPLYEQDDAGLKVPYAIAQYLAARPAGRNLAKVVGCDKGTSVYRCYQVSPRREPIVDKNGDGLGFLILNPDGILLAALQGSLQGRWLTLRSMKTAYKQVFRAAPGWDRIWTGLFPTEAEKELLSSRERYLYFMYSWLRA